MLKRAYRNVEQMAERFGYRIAWVPPASAEGRDGELSFEVEYVIAHLILQKDDIFFLQIGANDGRSSDPLNKFVTRFGWRGILLEPQPRAFAMLQQTYAGNDRVTLINAAVSEEDGTRTLYTVRQEGAACKTDLFSSFVRPVLMHQAQFVPDVAQRIEETTVRCLSLDTVLKEAARGENPDIIVIDTEGYDLNVLRMIDFDRLSPAIICYEHAHLSKAGQNEAVKLMRAQGYRLARNRLDTIAYKPEVTPRAH